MSSNYVASTSNEETDGNHDNHDENDVLIRDLEIEVFSSSQSINVDECLKLLKRVQEVEDEAKSDVEKLRNQEKTLEGDLLEQQISLEKAYLTNNENSRILSKLKRDKNDYEAKCKDCKIAEEVSQKEYKAAKYLHEDLEKQWKDVESLNEEIVSPEFEKRRLELEVLLEESKASVKEVKSKRILLNELNVQQNDAESSYQGAMVLLQEKKEVVKDMQDESKIMERRKQIVNAEKSMLAQKEELEILQKEVAQSKEKILEENTKLMELVNNQTETNRNLQEIQIQNNLSDDEVASLSKSIAIAQSQFHSYATTRMQLEIDLREANESFRHENASVILHRKQLDRMKRLYLKKKRIIEETNELIQQMTVSLNENLSMIKSQERLNEEQLQTIDNMKDDMNVKITRLMEQQNTEDGVKEEFDLINAKIEEEECEIDRWRTEVKKLCKIVSILTTQRETQMRKTRNMMSNEKETQEMIKLKTLVVLDMSKVLFETKKRAMEFSALYEVLKGEKNEIESATSATASALVEVRKRVENHHLRLQSLHQSQELKKLILVKERDAHSSSKNNRASLRVEKTKLRNECRQKREDADRCVLQITKLKSTLLSLQKESFRLKNRNGRLENGKRIIAEQLEDKKVEIHKLLQRANAYEEALKRGELAIQQKKEDIRALKLQCADIERHVSVKRTLRNDINNYKEKIVILEGELEIQRKQVETLSSQIEDPMHSNRWKELGGEDLDDEQLDAKINVLLQRLHEGKEQFVEREVMLEEIKSDTSQLQLSIKMSSEKSQPVVKKLNDYQTRLRDVTRSMMALVSELSMYHAIALKLEEEKEEQEESLQQSRQLVEEGKAPSHEALRDLKRLLRHNEDDPHSNSDNVDDGFGHVYYPAAYALRTTAEPRPSAYIPDTGIEIPKPYGTMAPFKPSDCGGSTMRRMRPPVANEFGL